MAGRGGAAVVLGELPVPHSVLPPCSRLPPAWTAVSFPPSVSEVSVSVLGQGVAQVLLPLEVSPDPRAGCSPPLLCVG